MPRTASSFISQLKTEWGHGHAFVTGEVQQNVFTIIKRARKNYFSIYDNDRDPVTGRKKLFFPLTESMVEGVVKNIDLDTRDMQVRAKNNPAGYAPSIILRHKIFQWMQETRFGNTLNKIIRFAAVDGTVVVKVIKKKKNGRTIPFVVIPDILNVLFDPSDTELENGIIERHLMTIDEFRRVAEEKKWKNTEGIEGKKNEFRTNSDVSGLNQTQNKVPYVVVWEYYGKVKKSWISEYKGKEFNEEDKWVDGHIIVHLDGNKKGNDRTLFLEETAKVPYKVFRYKEVHGRAHGKGVAEIIFDLQAYLNELLNIRANTNRLKHTGLFTVRKGMGVTQQMISSLLSGGVIPVNRQGDIDELRQTDQKSSSYNDENVIFNWAQRATGNFQVTSGEGLPASQPATTAAISNQGATTGFDLTREYIGLFLKEVFEDLIIPIIVDNMQNGERVQLSGDANDLRMYDEAVKNGLLQKLRKEFFEKNGRYMNDQERQNILTQMEQQFRNMGNVRYNTIVKEQFNSEFNVDFFVTNEALDKAVAVQDLVNLAGILAQFEAPANMRSLARKIIDLTGQDGARILEERAFAERPTGGRSPMETPQNAREQLTQANTAEVV